MVTDAHRKSAHKFIANCIRGLGDDPNRPGLVDTPSRIVKMVEKDIFQTVGRDPDPDTMKVFPNSGYDQIVAVTHISFSSFCEHHFLPYMGYAHIGYIPGKSVLGLSKFARIVNHFAARPTIQEELTENVSAYIKRVLKPKGLMVVVSAAHTCMTSRGIRNLTSKTTTSSVYNLSPDAKMEFLELVKLNGSSSL